MESGSKLSAVHLGTLRHYRATKVIGVIVAIAISLLYPLQICYDFDDKPDIGDILQAFIDISVSIPSTPDDDRSYWIAGLPHGSRPDIPDVEKILPAFWPSWFIVSEPGHSVESGYLETPIQQHFLQPWSRPPPEA